MHSTPTISEISRQRRFGYSCPKVDFSLYSLRLHCGIPTLESSSPSSCLICLFSYKLFRPWNSACHDVTCRWTLVSVVCILAAAGSKLRLSLTGWHSTLVMANLRKFLVDLGMPTRQKGCTAWCRSEKPTDYPRNAWNATRWWIQG